ncbi:membrane protease YdiL (CAAX protease family) [Hungatella effluvii]|uniref:Membrane protease YdiL (CAAX protease family) n=1 Tax=Hungatella effluvii TaxID=1096246 RepID=A0A2V3Y849_9FIRM|nr:type II CAAX endopeptidase family protein [Hungatella effluvii]PXX54981.1 membrane protease YdiL (CAAX protease family) [Hungatella effluvii]
MKDETLTRQEKIWKVITVTAHACQPLLLYLVVPALFSCVVALFMGKTMDPESFRWNNGQFSRTMGILLTFYLLRRGCKKREITIWDETNLYWKQINWRKFALLTVTGIGFSLFMSAVLTVVPLPQFLKGPYHELSSQVYDRLDTVFTVVSMIILAPVVEELVFRGYVLNRMLEGYDNPKTAVLASTILFAVCHGTPLWILYALFMGLLMSHVSIEEENIAYAIALHFGYNVTSLPIWLANRSPEVSAVVFASPVLVVCYGTVGICAAALCLRKYPLSLEKLLSYLPRAGRKKE